MTNRFSSATTIWSSSSEILRVESAAWEAKFIQRIAVSAVNEIHRRGPLNTTTHGGDFATTCVCEAINTLLPSARRHRRLMNGAATRRFFGVVLQTAPPSLGVAGNAAIVVGREAA